MTKSAFNLAEGVNVALPRQTYELQVANGDLRLSATCDNFDVILDMRHQLMNLGYRFVSLLPRGGATPGVIE